MYTRYRSQVDVIYLLMLCANQQQQVTQLPPTPSSTHSHKHSSSATHPPTTIHNPIISSLVARSAPAAYYPSL